MEDYSMSTITTDTSSMPYFNITYSSVGTASMTGTIETVSYGSIITDVEILSPNKVVQVTFLDGTKEKAVCSKEDDFSLEVGITICLAKKFLGGTKEYNSTIRKALKIIDNKGKLKEQAEEEKSRILKRQQKRKEYLAKREQKRREEEIKIREEAYYRAMKRMKSEKEK